jgi:hypothetical protein
LDGLSLEDGTGGRTEVHGWVVKEVVERLGTIKIVRGRSKRKEMRGGETNDNISDMIALNMSRFNTLAEISHATSMNGLSVTFFFVHCLNCVWLKRCSIHMIESFMWI